MFALTREIQQNINFLCRVIFGHEWVKGSFDNRFFYSDFTNIRFAVTYSLLRIVHFVNMHGSIHLCLHQQNEILTVIDDVKINMLKNAFDGVSFGLNIGCCSDTSVLDFTFNIILVLPPGVVCQSNCVLPMPGTADGDVVSRCQG